MDCGCDRKKRSKGDSKVLGLSNCKDEFLVNGVGNPLEEQGVGKIKSSVLYLLNLTCQRDSQMEILSIVYSIYGSGTMGEAWAGDTHWELPQI